MDRQAFVDLEGAARSQQWHKENNTDQFYDQQAHSVAQWQFGELPPKDVILGSLVEVALEHTQLDET